MGADSTEKAYRSEVNDAHFLHTYIHKYIRTYILHTYIHTYILTYIHTYIHTYTHAYVHTYTIPAIHPFGAPGLSCYARSPVPLTTFVFASPWPAGPLRSYLILAPSPVATACSRAWPRGHPALRAGSPPPTSRRLSGASMHQNVPCAHTALPGHRLATANRPQAMHCCSKTAATSTPLLDCPLPSRCSAGRIWGF